MTDNHEEIQKFLDALPDKFNILEEGVDIKTQIEFIEHSHTFDRGELTEEEVLHLSSFLFNEKTSIDAKKRALSLLAHLGTILAFRQIEKYSKNSDINLKQWTSLALQECKMFLENSLSDENEGFIVTGLGGLANKLRYYFLVLPLTDRLFTKMQKEIIQNEFPHVCKGLNSIVETVDLSDDFIGFTVLAPMDVAIGTVIETGIKQCNDWGVEPDGDFVFEHYYVTNTNIPDKLEINDIIKIIKED